jgi:hypothetical protein
MSKDTNDVSALLFSQPVAIAVIAGSMVRDLLHSLAMIILIVSSFFFFVIPAKAGYLRGSGE